MAHDYSRLRAKVRRRYSQRTNQFSRFRSGGAAPARQGLPRAHRRDEVGPRRRNQDGSCPDTPASTVPRGARHGKAFSMAKNIYVGNLTWDTTADDLLAL